VFLKWVLLPLAPETGILYHGVLERIDDPV